MNEMMLKAYFALRRVMVRQNGQGMTEYGLIIALVAVVVIGVLTQMGGKLTGTFQKIVDNIK
ncbi:MAG TPA: Flp family type IVb pilin [Symbiobacteriaceae bacterium]|jgi:pilus assembly protein Flp/PilA|nr:Flp family type IVb pilin [Symbiobacteriaceae bacterium]